MRRKATCAAETALVTPQNAKLAKVAKLTRISRNYIAVEFTTSWQVSIKSSHCLNAHEDVHLSTCQGGLSWRAYPGPTPLLAGYCMLLLTDTPTPYHRHEMPNPTGLCVKSNSDTTVARNT